MTSKSLQEIVDQNIKLTPMMEQYYNIKQNYPDAMLLFRMGDFYEVFFEDAIEASKILNITRTHRGKLGDFPIPMAGIPHHAASAYIDRLTGAGLKVAICEQVQDPKEAKGIVARAVTQTVSPGIPFDLDKAKPEDRHFLAAASHHKGLFDLIVIDFTTGHFLGHRFSNFDDFLDQIRLYSPKEFITFMGQWSDQKDAQKDFEQLNLVLDHYQILKTHLSMEYFKPKFSEVYLEKIIPGFKRDKTLKMHPEMLSPIGALAYYICSTQNAENYSQIKPFQLIPRDGHLKITLHTLKGIEVLPKSPEFYKDSLIGFLDKCQTAMGTRKLKEIITRPLTQIDEIKNRQRCIEELLKNSGELEQLRHELSEIRDIDRILTKVSTSKATASDLLNLAHAIQTYTQLKKNLSKPISLYCKELTRKQHQLLTELADQLASTINDEIGASLEKGNLIKPGASKKRDQLAKLSLNANDELEKLQEKYRQQTGILKLRVKSNNLAGFFIEVSKGQSHLVPKNFDRRQTLVNSERFTTKELNDFEKEIISAKDKLEKLEREIFKSLLEEVTNLSFEIQKLSNFYSLLDVFQSQSWVALQEGFNKPEIVEKSKIFTTKGMWHPLIKATLKDQFVCHDITLNEKTFFGLITGPNMAGKTTVMREVAILQLMAQSGFFVPAESASVGVCDYLFSRLGASDDILKGQSTFMVEMSETAEIVRHSTDRSLIILDEVGRGTSTYDGLSIAWALVEHLIEKTQALTLFATHYHELIEVVESYTKAKNFTVETENKGSHINFLYRLIEKPASQSFGIYVAKLAGLPKNILMRSEEILTQLEGPQQVESSSDGQLSFFTSLPPEGLKKEVSTNKEMDCIKKSFKQINIDQMTPIEALNKIHEIKENLNLN